MSPDIFLSYASEDISKARELVRLFEREGWSTWWDREIVPGRDFELEIDQALANSKVVVVLWSSFSVTSNWVRDEAKEAKNSNKLIPLLLDDSRIPLSFRSLNTIELSDWPNKQSLIELASLNSAISRILVGSRPVQSLDKLKQSDEMTLSVRVASRVAEMVTEGKEAQRNSEKLELQLLAERCIADTCLDLLEAYYEEKSINFDPYLIQLGEVLHAHSIIICSVDFENLSIASLQNLDGKHIDSQIEKRVFTLVNDYCTAENDFNLDLSSDTWPVPGVYCIPLMIEGSVRQFAWFFVDTESEFWSEEIGHRLLRIAEISQNHRSLK
ncbi:MAG: TIR domain-containing protein [Pseudomonadales bacterium]|nr:TIR domain-containing protein [Pseudomonadales bacterium]